ncbi:hypothetical protein [Aliikangiella sp. IMCC44359]|uniref:hypothetical protein n=1 Tax=Aliikangiella sp. IMCC44359 TaxID=3459125 RepID=UPI00403AABD9
MKYFALFLSLTLYSQVVDAKAYSWGDYNSWVPRIKAANEYVAKQYNDKGNIPVETRELAMYVIGFVEGMRDGIILHEYVKLKQTYGDNNIPNQVLKNKTDGICLNDTYSQIIIRLGKFIEEKKYRPGHDFMSVYLDFVTEEYPCKKS